MSGPIINPKYLEKLDPDQRAFVVSGPGNMFLNEFIWLKGNHCFVIGTTGSGKTNKGYWLVNYLKHSETQIWMDSGKSDEILPLLCQGKPVQIICPMYTDVIIEERSHGKWKPIENHPDIVHVPDAGDTWWAIKKNTLNILCFRNAFWTVSARAAWMVDLFETLATWTRMRSMPSIYPCSIHIDESQWVLAGTRISKDTDRAKSAEVITENALEIRSSGGRLIMYAQDFLNIPPAIRENLVCAILCRGADVSSDQSKKLSPHCNVPAWVKSPAHFKRDEGKFITEDGRSSPTNRPWKFSLFPKRDEDRGWVKRCRVRYEGFNDQKPRQAESEEECIPELGRFSAMAIKPEEQEAIITRWGGETITLPDQKDEEEQGKVKSQNEFLQTWATGERVNDSG